MLKSLFMLKRKIFIVLLLFFMAPVFYAAPSVESREAVVRRVIDGDTIVLANGERVRYIGIDTPEKGRPYYWEATKENERLVSGKKVELEFDTSREDKYGRTLAYVRIDGSFVNAELVKNGYAMMFTFPPNVRYAKMFLALQQEAIRDKRGLWSLSAEDIELIKGSHNIKGNSEGRTFLDYAIYRLKQIADRINARVNRYLPR
ncbi:MAG: thermonuclease family protein [Candidatus Omnitrophota bacterium]